MCCGRRPQSCKNAEKDRLLELNLYGRWEEREEAEKFICLFIHIDNRERTSRVKSEVERRTRRSRREDWWGRGKEAQLGAGGAGQRHSLR